jgi:predicted O-methyltransferase YrrM
MLTAEDITLSAPVLDQGEAVLETGAFELRALKVFRSLGHRVATVSPRIAHIGCRSGRATLALAREFPGARMVGIDCGEAWVARSREAARQQGLDHRVHFHSAPSDQLHLRGRFDLIVVSDPGRFRGKRLMPWLRSLVAEGGAVVLAGAGAAALGGEARLAAYREMDVAYVGCGREVCVLTA